MFSICSFIPFISLLHHLLAASSVSLCLCLLHNHAACLSIYSKLCGVTDRLVFHQTDWEKWITLSERQVETNSFSREHTSTVKGWLVSNVGKQKSMLCKMENSNICFMSLQWSHLWIAHCFIDVRVSEPGDI